MRRDPGSERNILRHDAGLRNHVRVHRERHILSILDDHLEYSRSYRLPAHVQQDAGVSRLPGVTRTQAGSYRGYKVRR